MAQSQFVKGVMDVAELTSLTDVIFCNIKYSDVDAVRKVGLLIDKLDHIRPDVQVVFI